MGRGRGGRRQSHGSSSRGSRGRGGRGNHRGNFAPPMSRRDKAHLSQFGEKHPSQELERDFGPSTSFPPKRGKFDRGRGRGRGGSYAGRPDNRGNDLEGSSSGSDTSEDEAITPYSELLSVFTGKKQDKTVQIVSEDEESDDDESENNQAQDGEDLSEDSMNNDPKIEDEAEDDENDDDSLSSDEEDSISSTNPDPDHDEDEDIEIKTDKTSKTSDIPDAEADAENDDEPEDTVIEDAELDPDINEAEGINTLQEVDPFVQHYEREMSEELQKEMKKDKPSMKTFNVEWPVIEKFTFVGFQNTSSEDIVAPVKSVIDLSEIDKLPEVKIPDPPLTPTQKPTLESLHVKLQMHSTIPLANQAVIDKEDLSQPLTSLQTELVDLASRYHDLYFPLRTINNAEEIRLAYCLHAANHILKTRTRILHHNAKMANKSEVPDAYRDQGFVRPKVVILVPFKDSAFRIVKTLISLILKEEKGNVANKKRFADEYGGETLFMPKTNPKPEDYTVTFSGNVDDNFKIGMAVTKKSIKLYTGFYSSDIIIASPLGLRMIIGADGEKDRDYDFLSSIELVILDQADVFLMQNWDHVLHLMRHLHLQPVTTHGTDFARIRPWALDGLAKYYCQTLVFSSIACPEHSSLMTKYCKNYAGQARVIPANLKDSIRQVTVQLPQVFQKFDVGSIQDADDARFNYFTKHVLPNFKDKLMSHTMIFVSSYFDFVRLRNYFRREEVSFVQICEYTKDKKVARARDLFFHGSNHFLLYTERSHFFRRFRLKGVGHIIFYQLPQNPQFYPELCNTIQEGFQNRRVRQRKNSSVNVIYCKYDTPRLAAIVGTERAGIMLSSEKNIHAFVSGDL